MLEVVTADVMKFDSILVKVVQNSKTELISLPVVRLWNSTTAKGWNVLLNNRQERTPKIGAALQVIQIDDIRELNF